MQMFLPEDPPEDTANVMQRALDLVVDLRVRKLECIIGKTLQKNKQASLHSVCALDGVY